jgi:hypothetical protein
MQHLQVKCFFAMFGNVVRTLFRITASVYVLVTTIKHQLHLPDSRRARIQILSATGL